MRDRVCADREQEQYQPSPQLSSVCHQPRAMRICCGIGARGAMGQAMSETDLSRSIRKELTKLGVWVIRSGVSAKRGKGGTHSGEPGQPDLCLPALGWLETKTRRGEPSPDQLKWHARAARSGVRVAVVRSVSEAISTVREWQRQATVDTVQL